MISCKPRTNVFEIGVETQKNYEPVPLICPLFRLFGVRASASRCSLVRGEIAALTRLVVLRGRQTSAYRELGVR